MQRFRRFLIAHVPLSHSFVEGTCSIKELPDGRGYEVGVHIADVAHFIPPGSALDQEARMRSTSSYLIQATLQPEKHVLCSPYFQCRLLFS